MHLRAPYFWQGSKNIQWRKDHLFTKWCWENSTVLGKRMKLEHFLTLYTKINSKWIKGLNVRPETINLLGENIGRTLNDINHSKILCNPPPRVMKKKTTTTTKKVNLKAFAHWRKLEATWKDNPQNGKNNTKWNNWQRIKISKIYKQLIQLNTRKTTNPIKKWEKS